MKFYKNEQRYTFLNTANNLFLLINVKIERLINENITFIGE